MSEYVITEEQLQKHMEICVGYGQTNDARTTYKLSAKLDEMEKVIKARPIDCAYTGKWNECPIFKPVRQAMREL